ncbi:MAG TPA: class I SAM-dependent methyltransferase [Steroidobacteraceae bacterium]|nr:class I SAM-dependent methyltransferase [Steroidobacteraceae bacterium]HRX88739.1 class I SAM-dependent methyltransferase [Steroidobacteraceae bacterium]
MTNSLAPPKCRFCNAELRTNFVDLGMSPLCQTHIEPHELNHMERFYPLHAWVCEQCWLVQLEQYVSSESIFSDYAYFSSYSDSWVEHARRYADSMIERFHFGKKSLVMEIASNDGYLLQHFVARGVPCRGIEPAANVAEVAVAKGIPTTVKFFGQKSAAEIAAEHGKPHLLLGNNVLAHVPDINDFVGGMKTLLAQGGVITMEFPHLLRLMDENQFDTIYHEHFSYLSFGTVQTIFAHHGLRLFDVDEIPTHGGSLRIYGCHADDPRPDTPAVAKLLESERHFGLTRAATYGTFEARVMATKRKLLTFLIEAKNAGKQIVGYGAPGKGNTLLNYCGIRTDFLDYTVDRSPHKYGRYTPGTHIPILQPEKIRETRPDYILILPWNLKKEIASQHSYVREWGGRFVVPIPHVQIVD